MAFPIFNNTGSILYARLEPYAVEDGANNWQLAHFCNAIGAMFDEVDEVVRDQLIDEASRHPRVAVGWSQIVDVTRAPERYLDWLAQFVGVRLSAGMTDAEKRAAIIDQPGFDRGTPQAMIDEVKKTLTGTQQVLLIERQGSAYHLTVTTWTSETPHPDATEAAILRQKPAGLTFTHGMIDGGTYDDLRDTHTNYDDVETQFTDYDEVRDDPTQT